MTSDSLQTQGDRAVTPDVAANLAAVRERIASAARQAGRRPDAVELVAVTKTHGPSLIELALDAGQRCFGENRVQEAQAKWPPLKQAHPDIKLHLVGPLQTNKAGAAVALFDVIETLDRPKLARAVAREMAKTGRRIDCFVEVNTGEEPQKAGVLPEAADTFIAACRGEFGLVVVGLMAIPPIGEEPALHFALLGAIARRNGLAKLSMGMSHDFEVAVAFGASQVRVGTAVFGPREATPGRDAA